MKKSFKSLWVHLVLILGMMLSSSCANDNIMDELVQDGRFKTLVQVLQASGLDETLRNDGPFTVFAPTDAAFQALGQDAFNDLLANSENLKTLLKSHIVSGQFNRSDLIDIAQTDGFLISLEGSQLNIKYDGSSLFVNDVMILDDDIEADNGIIHVIAQVLP